jgi:hypothetical protein
MGKQAETEAPGASGKIIPAREAVLAATKYYVDVTGKTGGVSVEEVELGAEGEFWMVTLGFPEYAGIAGMMTMQRPDYMSYKLFKVNAKTAEVVSMTIRKI